MSSVVPKKINHLGFVVSDLDAALKAWEGLFGVKAKIKENPDLQVRLGSFEIGGISIVLNESTHPDSRWAKYLEKHGPGLEHIALEIEDIGEGEKAAQDTQLSLTFDQPKPMHGFLTNFVQGIEPAQIELMGPEK